VYLHRYDCLNPIIHVISRVLKVGREVQTPFSLVFYWEGATTSPLSAPVGLAPLYLEPRQGRRRPVEFRAHRCKVDRDAVP
jgi:hypothetical protein